jgi:hypothetical protein
VLTALIDYRLVPDGSVTSATQLPEALAIRDEVDQHKQIELFAKFIAGSQRSYDLSSRSCAPLRRSSPRWRRFEEMDQFRMNNMQTYASWIAARGPLRARGPLCVSTRQAGETIWALASLDVARMLCDELGWTESHHARWLSDTLIQTLLPDD